MPTISLKTEMKEIDGLQVTCTQFPAMVATTLFARLLKTIGPSIGALMHLDPSTELTEAGAQLGIALAAVNPDELPALILGVLQGTAVQIPDEDGGKIMRLDRKESIDIVFSGRLLTLFKALGFAIQVNYRDFRSGGVSAAPGRPS